MHNTGFESIKPDFSSRCRLAPLGLSNLHDDFSWLPKFLGCGESSAHETRAESLKIDRVPKQLSLPAMLLKLYFSNLVFALAQ